MKQETTTQRRRPRGLRNNNPGNLRRTGDNWQGLRPVQDDPEFLQFEAPCWGYRALIKTLQTYRKKHGLRTVKEMIARWAPPAENDTAAYVRAVCRELQVPDSYVPDVDDRGTMCALASAISRVENGAGAVRADVERGWDLL